MRAVRSNSINIGRQSDRVRVAKGLPSVPRDLLTVLIIRDSLEYAFVIGQPPFPQEFLRAGVIDLLSSKRLSIKEEFHKGRVGTGAHIDQLPLAKVPVREEMHHGLFLIICPFCLKNIERVLFKAR